MKKNRSTLFVIVLVVMALLIIACGPARAKSVEPASLDGKIIELVGYQIIKSDTIRLTLREDGALAQADVQSFEFDAIEIVDGVTRQILGLETYDLPYEFWFDYVNNAPGEYQDFPNGFTGTAYYHYYEARDIHGLEIIQSFVPTAKDLKIIETYLSYEDKRAQKATMLHGRALADREKFSYPNGSYTLYFDVTQDDASFAYAVVPGWMCYDMLGNYPDWGYGEVDLLEFMRFCNKDLYGYPYSGLWRLAMNQYGFTDNGKYSTDVYVFDVLESIPIVFREEVDGIQEICIGRPIAFGLHESVGVETDSEWLSNGYFVINGGIRFDFDVPYDQKGFIVPRGGYLLVLHDLMIDLETLIGASGTYEIYHVCD